MWMTAPSQLSSPSLRGAEEGQGKRKKGCMCSTSKQGAQERGNALQQISKISFGQILEQQPNHSATGLQCDADARERYHSRKAATMHQNPGFVQGLETTLECPGHHLLHAGVVVVAHARVDIHLRIYSVCPVNDLHAKQSLWKSRPHYITTAHKL